MLQLGQVMDLTMTVQLLHIFLLSILYMKKYRPVVKKQEETAQKLKLNSRKDRKLAKFAEENTSDLYGSILYTVYCILYTVYCILYTVYRYFIKIVKVITIIMSFLMKKQRKITYGYIQSTYFYLYVYYKTDQF